MVSTAYTVVVSLIIDRRVHLVAAAALALLGSVVLGTDVTEAAPIVVNGPRR